jgi:uncharacterized coiled-coil DUF342 family protein
MSISPMSAIERSVRKAHRRLVFQRLVNALIAAWVVALIIGLCWVLAEPWLLETPPVWLRWAILGASAGVGTIVAILWAILTAPSRAVAALEVDTRFGLKERITTALFLRPEEQTTPAGQAVLADAQAKAATLAVGERFPIRPQRTVAFVPLLAAAIALAVVFYHPDTSRVFGSDDGSAPQVDEAAAKTPDSRDKPVAQFSKPRPPELANRPKSRDLEQLEEELDQMMEKWTKQPPETAERAREKITELTKMEEKVEKFNREKYEKLAQLEKQLQQLDRLNKDKQFGDGPARELNEALSKGDLKKAQDEIEELKKKVRDKKLDETDLEKLDQQIEKIKDELKKASENKQREQKLKEMIEKAKQEGRDAEVLERELAKLQDEMQQNSEMMDRMAERMQKMQQAIRNNDMNDLADELEKMFADMKEIEDELLDLEDSYEYLQKLKEEMKKACQACAECEGNEPGRRKDFAQGRGEGEREIDRTAQTSAGDEERIRGLFDPRGRKQYGGTTRGPAFTKRSSVELGEEIKQAAQEAPAAIETQRLPRDAQESVKEYFKRLGGTEER